MFIMWVYIFIWKINLINKRISAFSLSNFFLLPHPPPTSSSPWLQHPRSSDVIMWMLSIRVHTSIRVSTCFPMSCFMIYVCHSNEFPQIQKFIIGNLYLHDHQSSSGYLGKFLSLLSHLAFLKIGSCTLYADFYKEIADRASSSQVKKKLKIKKKKKMQNTCFVSVRRSVQGTTQFTDWSVSTIFYSHFRLHDLATYTVFDCIFTDSHIESWTLEIIIISLPKNGKKI